MNVTGKDIQLILFYLRKALLTDACFKQDYGALTEICEKLDEIDKKGLSIR